MAQVNEVCKNCLKWDKFKDKCWVWWEYKKECSQKVTDMDQWAAQEKIK